jgi:hypothetical protein
VSLEIAYVDGQLAALVRYKLGLLPAEKATPSSLSPEAMQAMQPPTTPQKLTEIFDAHEQGETRTDPRRKLSAENLCTTCRKAKHYGGCSRPRPIPEKTSNFNPGMHGSDPTSSDGPSTGPNYHSAVSSISSLARAQEGRPADEQAASGFADLFRHQGIRNSADEPGRMYGGLNKTSGLPAGFNEFVLPGLATRGTALADQLMSAERPMHLPRVTNQPRSALPATPRASYAPYRAAVSAVKAFAHEPLVQRLGANQMGHAIGQEIAKGQTLQNLDDVLAAAKIQRQNARRKLGDFMLPSTETYSFRHRGIRNSADEPGRMYGGLNKTSASKGAALGLNAMSYFRQGMPKVTPAAPHSQGIAFLDKHHERLKGIPQNFKADAPVAREMPHPAAPRPAAGPSSKVIVDPSLYGTQRTAGTHVSGGLNKTAVTLADLILGVGAGTMVPAVAAGVHDKSIGSGIGTGLGGLLGTAGGTALGLKLGPRFGLPGYLGSMLGGAALGGLAGHHVAQKLSAFTLPGLYGSVEKRGPTVNPYAERPPGPVPVTGNNDTGTERMWRSFDNVGDSTCIDGSAGAPSGEPAA